MALTRSLRSADLANLDLKYTVELTWQRVLPSPQRHHQNNINLHKREHGTEFFFPNYSLDDLLCPVLVLKEYESHTK